jgi:hypothetical protein
MEDYNRARVQRAVTRLTMPQRRLVGERLDAIVHGTYLPDWEFSTVMGNSREEVCAVASAWPAVGVETFWAVNNALNNLLGYPHGRWNELTNVLGVKQQAAADVLEAWRSENPPADRSGSSYVDFLVPTRAEA